MDKAVEAREKNEENAEFEAVKLAVTSSIAKGLTGLVEDANLVNSLSEAGFTNVTNNEDNTWTVQGGKGLYLVRTTGLVEKVKGLNIAESLSIKEGTIKEITVKKYGDATNKEVSWEKTGNITFVTDNEGTTVVTGTPTGDTVYVKAGVFSETNASANSGTVVVKAEGEESKSCNITIKSGAFILGEAKAGSAEKYGWKVNGYTSIAESQGENVGGWRLFYQDDENTYIISNNLTTTTYKPSDYYNVTDSNGNAKYTGATTSAEGKGLNEKVKSLLTSYSTALNMKATAWFTDTSNNSPWIKYKDTLGKASFAIASPTAELFVKSFNAAADVYNVGKEETFKMKKIFVGVGDYGYIGKMSDETTNMKENVLSTSYNNGIYLKDTTNNWFLASPEGTYNKYGMGGCMVYAKSKKLGRCNVSGQYESIFSIRPIVCIPNPIFESSYTLSDE